MVGFDVFVEFFELCFIKIFEDGFGIENVDFGIGIMVVKDIVVCVDEVEVEGEMVDGFGLVFLDVDVGFFFCLVEDEFVFVCYELFGLLVLG